MIKRLLMVCMLLLLAACSTQDSKQYYQTHPQALQDAVKNCPAAQPSGISCQQLTEIAMGVNELAYQLQMNPQAFGKKILALQETVASQRANLRANPNQPDLKIAAKKNEHQLAECLAIIRWLESPES